jgi:hypothetical protein
VVDGNVTSPDANKRGVRSVFLPVAIVLGRKPSSNLRRIHSGRANGDRSRFACEPFEEVGPRARCPQILAQPLRRSPPRWRWERSLLSRSSSRSPRNYTRRIERETHASAAIKSEPPKCFRTALEEARGRLSGRPFSRGWQRAYLARSWRPGEAQGAAWPSESYSDVILRLAAGKVGR